MRLLTKHTNTRKFEPQFTPKCDVWRNRACEHPATWAAWSAHADNHEEWFSYCCDKCKELAQRRWKEYVGKRCVCGYAVEGTIDRHLRFIRL